MDFFSKKAKYIFLMNANSAFLKLFHSKNYSNFTKSFLLRLFKMVANQP